MKFARRVFLGAGIYGLIVVGLGYASFLTGADPSLAITSRPEIVHGFFLVTLAWQVMFLCIAQDPVRYRLMMLPSILEKIPFGAVCIWLFTQFQIEVTMLALGLIDLMLGLLFTIAFVATKAQAEAS